MVDVLRSRFTGTGQDGDFAWMITQPEYARTLFVFNDNEEEFYAHLRGGQHTCSPGGGNAAIRPWQCRDEPHAAGVPTGSYTPGPHYMGYSTLSIASTLARSAGSCRYRQTARVAWQSWIAR